MKCTKIDAARDRLLDPAAPEWTRVPSETLKLDATPLANQPSEYVKASRDERTIGKVRSLSVQAAHDGREIFFRLSWEDSTRNARVADATEFSDACGILMPLRGGDPPIDEMGSRDAPVNAWYWRASLGDRPRNTIAQGLGTTRFTTQCAIVARSSWIDGKWAVVLARPLAVPEQKDEATQLRPGTSVKVGFAVWEGSNGERGGIKSFSKEWRELEIEA
jgi:DMSO reductase family type II enzyme heme b subunit